MTRKRTRTTAPRTPQLSDKQRIALEAELAGKTTTDAAILAGVTRQTVSEWRNHDPEYRAARNAAAWDQMGHIAMRVRSELLPIAFADLAKDMASDDTKVRQRARADVLRYERQLPDPPPADPDLEQDAGAWRTLTSAFADRDDETETTSHHA